MYRFFFSEVDRFNCVQTTYFIDWERYFSYNSYKTLGGSAGTSSAGEKRGEGRCGRVRCGGGGVHIRPLFVLVRQVLPVGGYAFFLLWHRMKVDEIGKLTAMNDARTVHG